MESEPEILTGIDWLVMNHGGIYCQRCKQVFPIENIPLVSFPWLVRGLQEAHKLCKERHKNES